MRVGRKEETETGRKEGGKAEKEKRRQEPECKK